MPSWSWVDLLLILVGITAIFLLGFTLFGLWVSLTGTEVGQVMEPSVVSSLALALLESAALAGSVYVLGMRRRGVSWRQIGLRQITRGWFLTVLVISMIVIPLSGLISTLILLLLGRPLENPQIDFLLPEGFTWFGAIGMLLLGGIAVPFAEELLFRGVLYVWLRERWGLWPGILLSSLIFGVVHVDIAVAGAAFVLGIVLALVFEYSRSLWSAVLVHALNNSVKIALLYAFVALGVDVGL